MSKDKKDQNQKDNQDQDQNNEETKNKVVPGFDSLENFELAQRTARMLSKSSLVPKRYQDNLPNCVIALNMANRMDADPLMVMQNLYIVHGQPAWSAQFLISTFNTSGKFSAIRYNWVGEEGTDSWGCQAWAVEKETGEKLEGSTITIALAKREGWFDKNNSKWQTMPEQMLMYRAAAWFIRSYAPEIAMGMHTEDEIIDVTPDQYQTVETEVENEINENANKEEFNVEEDAPEEEKEEDENNNTDSKDKSKDKNKNKDENSNGEQTSISDQDDPGF